MTVGQRLKEARKSAKISGEVLGELVGVSKGQISNIEKGTSQLTKANAMAFAAALGISVDWLLNGEGEMVQTPLRPGASVTNKSKSTGNVVHLGGYQNQSSPGSPDLQIENEKLRLENEYLKQRLKDKEEMIELLKKK